MGRELQKFVDSQLKFDSELTRGVKQYEYLFNVNHELFNNKLLRSKAWESIGHKLGKTAAYCETRWVCIINRLWEELCWQQRFKSTSFWLLFPQLEFIYNNSANWPYIELEVPVE
ncbi:uncharacterized protein LOC115890269 [Sitophilus oryzae]|uniref:Uncharacterized protein LOC115890269 n=1 Tax=Sitophilus oryzae TaxID=7048 RepID=A0A6J2YSM6_SITOR|nr:uncharacterized protein LOC115890269 [Sitophilus oryzae]